MNQNPSDFWTNAKIRAHGVAWENEQKEQARDDQQSAGAATAKEREELVDANESRADRRDAADGRAPSVEDQLAAAGGR